ncbi:hypothetical protein H5410_030416 [Solanum commersonii]|uniref:Uncharacterized protein n=1 Tax=Solanum commersonii TaxID=4109 RepID=A0A9J5YJA0_SOLCO|nr:hypothetical protein H5410_030416 [Solanum commersonii]
MIQGHNEQECYVEHPELYPTKEKNTLEQRNTKDGGGKRRQPEKVWTKVGLITGNKFAALNKENVEQKNCQISKSTKGNEKCADEVQRTIPGVQLSQVMDNESNPTTPTDIIRNSMKENGIITISEDIQSVPKGGFSMMRRDSNSNKTKEDHYSKNDDNGVNNGIQRSDNSIEGIITKCTPRNLIKAMDTLKENGTGINNKDNMGIEEIGLVLKKGPDLVDEAKDELQFRKETDEDNDMEYNVQQISKA